jgi:RNA-splicing ligase RtcB
VQSRGKRTLKEEIPEASKDISRVVEVAVIKGEEND